MLNFIFHPVTTFFFGAIVAILFIVILLVSCTGPNDSAKIVEDYRTAMKKAGANGPAPGTAEEKAAIERFSNFLKNVGTKSYIEENTAKVYTEGAFLDDTIATHYGPEEIKKYFLKTADTMTSFEVTIDDSSRSGPDHYIRWTMTFAAPALAKGEPIVSVGISQVRFDSEGKVAFHQDFWDSGKNIYGKAPFVGGMIGIVRKRMND